MDISGAAGKNDLQSKPKNANITVSPKGKNVFLVKGFINQKLETRHVKKHLKEYPSWTRKQYRERAIELLEQPVGGDIVGFMNASGAIIRYDCKANDYAVGNPAKGAISMYKPKKGKKWFEKHEAKEAT